MENKGFCRINDEFEFAISHFSETQRNNRELILNVNSNLEKENTFLVDLAPYTEAEITKIEFLDENKESVIIYTKYNKMNNLSVSYNFSNEDLGFSGNVNFIID